MKTLSLILFVILLSLQSIAQNNAWVKIYYNDKFELYVNKDRLTWNGNICNAWMKRIYKEGEAKKEQIAEKIKRGGANVEKWLDWQFTIINCEYDCSAKKERLRQIIDYTKEGEVIENFTWDNHEWDGMVPETVGETIINKICELKPNK